MEIGLVRRVDIDHEMQQSYLDYAMSVIVSRALPDARDGLKPVQRRILYAMYDMGLRPDAAYKKSARIVGEVLGKYHPHGDLAVYEAMARMAQDFSMRSQLVDGQGNFGSVDGDPPAAMRYTEARLTPVAMEMLNQLDRNTVDFLNNFDETLGEPEVLPAAIPNLLVNGGSGIAVGMATSIPPHNLQEVIDALVYMLNRWEDLDNVSISDLMQFVKGPDFPTGGIILQESDKDDLLSAYATGRGRVVLRGRVHTEEMGRGRSRIIVTELPYQTNKSALMERIADLVREGDLEGIADLRDESDRRGMRIVIELNKAAEQENVLRELYKRTSLQSTFRISLLALVDNEPRLLGLKQALRVYLEHRLVIIRRRSEYDLARARQRAHILEGLLVALKNLDDVINLIRKSADAEEARAKLIKKYKLDEVQANAILEMPLRRLASLERKKIEEEYKELQATIKDLESLLASPKRMRQVVQAELMDVRSRYADKRRTQIVRLAEGEVAANLLTTNDLTPDQDVWVAVNSDGLIGRFPIDRLPKASGREAPRWVISSNTHHTLYLVNKEGRAAAIPVQTLPELEAYGGGVPFHKISPLTDADQLASLFSIPSNGADIKNERFVVTVTHKGIVKKTVLADLPGPSAQLFTLVKVNDGDELGWTLLTDGSAQLFFATANGMAIRFNEQEVRPMGLVAAGVNGIKLAENDEVVGAAKIHSASHLLLVSTDGRGWHIPVAQFPLQGRYGQGVIATKLSKGAALSGLAVGKPAQPVIVRPLHAAVRSIRIENLQPGKRAAVGQDLVPVKANDRIVGVSQIDNAIAFWKPEAAGAAESETKPKTRREPKATSQLALPLENGAGKSRSKKAVDGKAPSPAGNKAAVETKQPSSRSKAAKPESKPVAAAKKPPAKKAATSQKAGTPVPAKKTPAKQTAPSKAETDASAEVKKSTPRQKPAASKSKPAGAGTAKEPKPAAENKPTRQPRKTK